MRRSLEDRDFGGDSLDNQSNRQKLYFAETLSIRIAESLLRAWFVICNSQSEQANFKLASKRSSLRKNWQQIQQTSGNLKIYSKTC
jgi:hypothetical protein